MKQLKEGCYTETVKLPTTPLSFLATLPRLLKCRTLSSSTFHRALGPWWAQDLQLAASGQGTAGVFPLQSKLEEEGVGRQEGFPLDQLHIQGTQRMQTASAMTLHIREESPRLTVLQLNARHLGSVQMSCRPSCAPERCGQMLARVLFLNNTCKILATIWKGIAAKCGSFHLHREKNSSDCSQLVSIIV